MLFCSIQKSPAHNLETSLILAVFHRHMLPPPHQLRPCGGEGGSGGALEALGSCVPVSTRVFSLRSHRMWPFQPLVRDQNKQTFHFPKMSLEH